ncbi:SEL1-like repeat protein [Burkholderia sp. LMG 32019]|uniref:SEL1-like repeat protein n=1 Tax=Burkholderia sp. LMG 32019 TaxID=3158173 RepID=UPI003C2CAA51
MPKFCVANRSLDYDHGKQARSNKRRTPAVLLISCLLAACSKSENAVNPVPDVDAVRLNLAFTCVHEADHLPSLDAEADKLFRYGRYLQKLKGEKDFDDIARYYRIAAAYDHYKANGNVQLLISQGLVSSPDAEKESVDLAARLVDQQILSGYYDIGHYLEGGYGLKKNPEMSLRYFRKAADMGSPEAQYYVADLLAPIDKAPTVAKEMRECATAQGFGKAASALGIDLKTDKHYAEAVKVFQKGVESGNIQSASFLENGFEAPPESDRLYYLALPNDPERARRYDLIERFLDHNDGRNPGIPDIDKIVPLPPAKLPPWDGSFQWQKEQDAAIPPQKPSDELVSKMAKAKHLDPATGLPLPGSADKPS